MDKKSGEYTEQDLNFLIEEHLTNCEQLTHVCRLKQTEAGKQRIITRIKELFFKTEVRSVEEALAIIESEIIASEIED